MTWHALIAKPEFERAVRAERRRQIEKGYDAAHDDEHGIDHLRRWRASYFRRGLVIAAAALDIAIEEHLARLASRCTCPTGDGSLRCSCSHPEYLSKPDCPVHGFVPGSSDPSFCPPLADGDDETCTQTPACPTGSSERESTT